MNTSKWQAYDSLVVSILTIYTFCLLTAMDIFLASFIDAYNSTGSIWLGALIFFFVTHLLLYFFQPFRTQGYFIYYIAGLSIFFPLVLLTSILRFSLGFSGNQFDAYAEFYCTDYSAGMELCGEAFSYIVFSMTIRSLPVVITIPLLYRWFYLKRFSADMPNS